MTGSTRAPLRFGGAYIKHPGAVEKARGERPEISLHFFTPGGTLREVALSEHQALRLIHDLSGYLHTLALDAREEGR